MPDSPTTGLSDEERLCIEALAKVYLTVNSSDIDLGDDDKQDLSRCVRCLQDRILALPTRRRLRRETGGT